MTKVKPPAAWMSVEFSKSVLLQLSSLSTISFNDYYSSSVMMINQIIALFRYNFSFAKNPSSNVVYCYKPICL